MVRLLFLLLLFCVLAQAEVLPPPTGATGVEGSGFIVRLTERQWDALAGEKITEKDGVSIYSSKSSKWSILLLYKEKRFFLLHSYFQYPEKYSIDSRGNPKNILLSGHTGDKTAKFLIDTEAVDFLWVGF